MYLIMQTIIDLLLQELWASFTHAHSRQEMITTFPTIVMLPIISVNVGPVTI